MWFTSSLDTEPQQTHCGERTKACSRAYFQTWLIRKPFMHALPHQRRLRFDSSRPHQSQPIGASPDAMWHWRRLTLTR